MKLIVEVKQEHIDKGKRCSCALCPVALALNDVNGVDSAEVIGYVVNIIFTDKPSSLVEVPPDVLQRIDVFDRYGIMGPFIFELGVPDARS